VKFLVTESGSIENARIVKGLTEDCNKEAPVRRSVDAYYLTCGPGYTYPVLILLCVKWPGLLRSALYIGLSTGIYFSVMLISALLLKSTAEVIGLIGAGAFGAGAFFLVTKLLVFPQASWAGQIVSIVVGEASITCNYLAKGLEVDISIPAWILTYGWALAILAMQADTRKKIVNLRSLSIMSF
jgi:hypothetical protein